MLSVSTCSYPIKSDWKYSVILANTPYVKQPCPQHKFPPRSPRRAPPRVPLVLARYAAPPGRAPPRRAPLPCAPLPCAPLVRLGGRARCPHRAAAPRRGARLGISPSPWCAPPRAPPRRAHHACPVAVGRDVPIAPPRLGAVRGLASSTR